MDQQDYLKVSTEHMEQGSGQFDRLSDVEMLHIFSFMDPADLIRLRMTCKRFYLLTRDKPLWREHARREGFFESPTGSFRNPTFYMQRFLSFRKKEAMDEMKLARELYMVSQSRRVGRATSILRWAALGRGWEWFDWIMLLLIGPFMIFKLDTGLPIPWGIVLLPFFLLVLQIFFASGLYLTFTIMYRTTFQDELDYTSKGCGPLLFFLLLVSPLASSPQTVRPLLAAATLCLGVFGISVIVKLAISSLPYVVVFLPVVAEFVLLIVAALFAGGKTIIAGKGLVERLFIIPVAALLALSLVFLTLRLDEFISVPYFVVFIPIYVVLALFCILTPIHAILDCFFGEPLSRVSLMSQEAGCPAIVCCATYSVTIPSIIALILVTLILDGVMSVWFLVAFFPMAVLLCVCTGVLGCCNVFVSCL